MQVGQVRRLAVIADDFGIGPNTSAGILALARRGLVTGSVLLVNSPYAEADVQLWRRQGCPMELGWHPNLTLDAPILNPGQVQSLVASDGRFWPLGAFLTRWLTGRLNAREIEAEFHAQLLRFRDLTGAWPTVVNSHQHVALFPPVGRCLLRVLQDTGIRPYVRRVREPWPLLWRIRGARKKRTLLNLLGRELARTQEQLGFPGNDWAAGTTDPPWVRDASFFTRILNDLPGQRAELVCHPGEFDPTLVGRDCRADDGLQQRRVDELNLLQQPGFLQAAQAAGLTLVTPTTLAGLGGTDAAAA